MPILNVDPPNFEACNVIQVDCDAPTNKDAILEIEKWAAERGFLRTNEYGLRRVLLKGRVLFRGICYRQKEEEVNMLKADEERINALVESMPVTRHAHP